MQRSLVRPLARPLAAPIIAALDAGASFSPSSLFASSEAGAWYDPSDITSLYAARDGSSAASVDGVVGMMLDKRLMGGQTAAAFIAAQPQLVTNGGFDVDSDWTKNNAATIAGGVANLSAVNDAVLQTIAGTQNATVVVKFDSVRTSGTNIRVYVGGNIAYDANTPTGSHTLVLKGQGLSDSFQIRSNGFVGTIDNVSVKIIPGNHAIAPSDAARPILRSSGGLYWLEFDGVDDHLRLTASLSATTTLAAAVYFDATEDSATMLSGSDISNFVYAVENGGASPTISFVNGSTSGITATYRVNGAAVTPTTRDQAFDAIGVTIPRVFVAERYNATDDTTWNIPGNITGFFLDGRWYGGVLINRDLTAQELGDLEAYLAANSGASLT